MTFFGFSLFIIISFILVEQGTNYDYFPFSVMKRRRDALGIWEDYYIEVVPDESLDEYPEYHDEQYQSWGELGDRYMEFYLLRLINVDQFNHLASEDPKSPACAPHYVSNLFAYNLTDDINDIFPSLSSLCGKDVTSTMWELSTDLFLPYYANAHLIDLLKTRVYPKRVYGRKRGSKHSNW